MNENKHEFKFKPQININDNSNTTFCQNENKFNHVNININRNNDNDNNNNNNNNYRESDTTKTTTLEDLDKINFLDVKSLEDLKARIPKDVTIDIQDFLLANKFKHPRDPYMLFNEKFHKYFLFDPQSQQFVPNLISITTLVGSKCAHFDADAIIAKNKPKWDANPKDPYHGMTAQAIKDQWTYENKAGTFLHRQIELYYNNVLDQHPEGREEHIKNTDFQYFLNFDREIMKPRGYTIYRTEWRIYCPISRVCGTIDCVVIPDMSRPNEVIIFDWKRTKKLEPFQWDQEYYGKYMKAPIKFVGDSKINHYMLQLHLYKILLERHYGLKVLSMHLGVFHPINSNFVIFDIEPLYANFAKMLIKERETLFNGNNNSDKSISTSLFEKQKDIPLNA
jgi:hypothetical protein